MLPGTLLIVTRKRDRHAWIQEKEKAKEMKTRNKKLAAMYGDKKKITRGDIITAAKRKKAKQTKKST